MSPGPLKLFHVFELLTAKPKLMTLFSTVVVTVVYFILDNIPISELTELIKVLYFTFSTGGTAPQIKFGFM